MGRGRKPWPGTTGWILVALLAGCGERHGAERVPPEADVRGTEVFDDAEFEAGIVAALRETPPRVATASLATLLGELGRAGGRGDLAPLGERESSPEGIYETAAASTVAIVEAPTRCDECPEWHLGGGASGFLVTADGLCATNWHVVGEAEGELYAVTRTGEVHGIVEVVAASEAEDIAILRLGGRGFTPLPLAPAVRVGATVYTVSHPSGRYFTFSEGRVARVAMEAVYARPAPKPETGAEGAPSPAAEGKGTPSAPKAASPETSSTSDRGAASGVVAPEAASAAEVRPMIMITADFGAGSSGGPVLDARGNVVGMIAETETVYADQDAYRDPQMVFRLCVPASRILALLGR